jgi:hypothetical protein
MNAIFWDGRRVTTDVSEERTASITIVKRISELGKTLAVTSNCKHDTFSLRTTLQNLNNNLNARCGITHSLPAVAGPIHEIFSLLKFRITQSFITIKTSWNIND